MINASDIFLEYADSASELMESWMAQGFSPVDEKKLKRWNMAEVAALLSVTPSYLKKAIDAEKIPSGDLNKRGNRRTFSIDEINLIREYLMKTNPKKHDKYTYFRKHSLTQIIAVANFKGGVGKSTTTVTLAHDLALRGYKVLVADLDGQGSTTTMFGFIPNKDIPPESTIEPFIEANLKNNRFDGFKPTDLNYCCIQTNWSESIDLIPANLATSYADIALSLVMQQGYRYWEILKNGFDTLKGNYDIILLDFPPSLGYLAMNGIYACDSLLVPVPPDMLDFSSSSAFFEQLADVSDILSSESGKPLYKDFAKLVMTKCPTRINEANIKDLVAPSKDKRNREAKKMKAFMLKSFGEGLLQNEIVYSEAFKEASSNFRSIYEMEKSNMSCAASTLTRALESTNQVHSEIEELIQKAFTDKVELIENSYTADAGE